jgi:type III restriction enzyme
MIVFDKNKVKYAYFVAETKGSKSELDIRAVEKIKIKCAKKHFDVISDEKIKFDVVSSWEELKNVAEFIK